MPDNRTYSDRREYIKKAVQKRRIKIRKMALEYAGGKCQICGYDKCSRALVYHHINPNKKSFGISARGFTRSWEKIKKELDKCILLCSNCHMEVHDGITQLPVRKSGRKTR
jgi:5-methylcytosine-specific restriction endonuclease McrA